MKRILAFLIACMMIFTGCARNIDNTKKETAPTNSEAVTDVIEDAPEATDVWGQDNNIFNGDYVENLGYDSLGDEGFLNYIEDCVYTDLVNQIDSSDYFVENVAASYVSNEYLEELEYNSQENIFFGYTLSELNGIFDGTRYIFSLDESGQTVVKEFEEYKDSDIISAVRNVAIGTGVILICVTVSSVTAVGAPAVSLIFAASAKSAAWFAVSSGAISTLSAIVSEGFESHDFKQALESAVLSGSEGYMWGAFGGVLSGGISEAWGLWKATAGGLTMNEVAKAQMLTKYPLDVIKKFNNMEQVNKCIEDGLVPRIIDGKIALVQNIDPDFADESGVTNLQKMLKGETPLDSTGTPYELHHLAQENEGTLAVLTQEQHRSKDAYSIWHDANKPSEIDRPEFDKIRKAFWKEIGQMFAAG